MYGKLHRVADSIVLACCDAELLGKTLEDGELCMKINKEFYKGKLIDEATLEKLLNEANNINLIGNKAVKVAIEKGYVTEKDVLKIKNVSHVQIFKV